MPKMNYYDISSVPCSPLASFLLNIYSYYCWLSRKIFATAQGLTSQNDELGLLRSTYVINGS